MSVYLNEYMYKNKIAIKHASTDSSKKGNKG